MPGILPSQMVLLLSGTIYHLLSSRLTRRFSESTRHSVEARTTTTTTTTDLHKSRELLSILHGTIITIATISALFRFSAAIFADPSLLGTGYTRDIDLPLISTRSELLNCLAAIETGYLLADLLALGVILRDESKERRDGASSSAIDEDRGDNRPDNPAHVRSHVKGSASALVLTIHHLLLLCGLSVLHLFFISRGRERGVLVIVMLLLLNASNPLGSLRWWVVNFGNRSHSDDKCRHKFNVGKNANDDHAPGHSDGNGHLDPRVSERDPAATKPQINFIRREPLLSIISWSYLVVYALVRVVGIGVLLHIWALQLSLLENDFHVLPWSSSVEPFSSPSSPSSSAPKTIRLPLNQRPNIPLRPPTSIYFALISLRPWCIFGTLLLWAGNSAWLTLGIWKALSRVCRSDKRELQIGEKDSRRRHIFLGEDIKRE